MNRHQPESSVLRELSRVLCLTLSVGVVMIGVPVDALAQGAPPAPGGSIVIDIVDPDTGEHVPAGLLRSGKQGRMYGGQQYRLVAHAFDEMGRAIPCTQWTFDRIQGVSGNQIRDIAGDLMTMGSGWGSAEVTAQCAELPGVVSKMFIANNTLETPAQKKQEQPNAAKPGHGGGVALAILGGLAVAGAAAYAVGQAAGTSTDSGNSCLTRAQCCNDSSVGLCGLPPGSSCPCPIGTRDDGICQAGKPCNTLGGFTPGTRLCSCR